MKMALQEAKRFLTTAIADRDKAIAAQADAELRIIQYRRAVVSLAVVCNEVPELESMGLTDSVRVVMKDATTAKSVREVKEALATVGFDLSTHKNADASVTTVLNRLAEAKEIRKVEAHQNGKTFFTFLGPKGR